MGIQGDNINQHYTALTYIGKWYRQIIRNIFIHHDFNIPLYDFDLQYGADIISTFSHYGIGDPFNILSAVVPAKYTEYLFWFLMVLRTYVMGIAFSKYSFYRGNSRFSTLTGSIIYLSCGFNIGPCISQIIFQSALVWFPFVLLGVEKAFREKKFGVYVISSGLFACSSVYFYYMAVFGIILYCIIYVIINKFDIQRAFKYAGAFLFNSILALGLFGFLIFPVSISMLTNARVGTEFHVPFLYELSYYLSLPGYIFNTGSTYSEYFGFSPVAVVLLIFLLVRPKSKYLKITVGITAICLMIPWFGHLLNGNSYVGNRWTYMLAFGMAYCTTVGIAELGEISESEKRKVLAAILCLGGVCLAYESNRTSSVFWGLFICAIFFLGCILLNQDSSHKKFQILTFVCIFAGIFNLTQGIGATFGNRINLGDVYDKVNNTPARIAGHNIEKDRFCRIDQSGGALTRYNQSLYHFIKSTEYYWSTASSTTLDFLTMTGISSYFGAMSRGVDSRRLIEDFLGVKYFLVKGGEEKDIPYSFDEKIADEKIEGSNYSLYKSDNSSIDLIRYYKNTISPQAFEAAALEDRQEILLQAAVVEGENQAEGLLKISNREIEYTIVDNDDVKTEEGKFIVEKDKAYLTLELSEVPRAGELYVVIEGMEYKGTNPFREADREEADKVSGNQKWQNLKKSLKWKEESIAEIQFGYDKTWKSIKYPTPDNQHGYGRDSFICNLGYHEVGESSKLQVYFIRAGEYKLSSLRVVVQPMNELKTYERDMYDSIEQETHFSVNAIQSELRVLEEGHIQYALPFSTGWKAYVNGEETELKKSSVIFMGCSLPAGDYRIELKYTTPGLKAGICFSLVSLGILAAMFVLKRKEMLMRRRKTRSIVITNK